MIAALQYALLLLAPPAFTFAQPPLLPFKPFNDAAQPPYVCHRASSAHSDTTADFLILGAGMAGFGAAHYLHAHTRNCIIRVIEARHEPGGRVRTIPDGPFRGMEVGAGWIHEYRGNPMLAVAHAMKIGTKWVGGDSSYVGGGLLKVYDGGRELTPAVHNRSFELKDDLLNRIDDEVRLRIKQKISDVSLLTAILNITSLTTLAPIDKRLLRWHLDVIFGGDWAAPLDKLSLMALKHGPLAYEGGDCVFPHGFGQIPSALAEGVDVRYKQVATHISWDNGGVSVKTDNGEVWKGDKLLITASLGVQRSGLLSFDPPLPSLKRATLKKFGMASLNRIMLRFPRAFWEDGTYTFGFLPESLPNESKTNGKGWVINPVFSVAVVAAYEGRQIEGGCAILTFMIGGDSGAKILAHSHASILAHLLRLLRLTFGATFVPNPTSYRISDWTSEPFALGSYAYLPVNTSVYTDVPLLIEPVNDDEAVDRLFWAGEATMKGLSKGTTHGAFLSGVREAARMLERTEVVEKVVRADEADVIGMSRSATRLDAIRDKKRGMGTGIVVEDWFGVGDMFDDGKEILCGESDADHGLLLVDTPRGISQSQWGTAATNVEPLQKHLSQIGNPAQEISEVLPVRLRSFGEEV